MAASDVVALRDRWEAVHAATVPLVHAIGPTEESSAVEAAAARLPPGTLDPTTLSLALARTASTSGSHAEQLAGHLDELEAVVEEMHDLMHDARGAASSLSTSAAAQRGPQGLLSPADRAVMLSMPLRCYEAELALKRWISEALQQRVPLPATQKQALLVAWQCQPMLEPMDAMLAGEERQHELEAALGSSTRRVSANM